MSRSTVLNGYRHYEQQQAAFGGVGVGVGMVPAGPTYRLPGMMRAPELSAGYTPQPTTGHHGRHSTFQRMAAPAFTSEDEELAQFQKLSNEYEPPATGPLVGERQSSSAITAEYQHADPVYQVKTAALPQKYAYFRTCLGDGHCGWRAIAFSYFEALLRTDDRHRFEDEEVRLKSMRNLHNAAGHSPDIVDEFASEAFDLMRQLAAVLHMHGQAADLLLHAFNDYSQSMAIVTYFKLLASAWIQSHPESFLPFLLDYSDLRSYCGENIEAANCEIDHVAMAALGDVIVKPAGFGLEVLYLDRSPGDEINNTYRVEPTGNDGYPLPNAPTMRLLYRPGHYDILYKAEDFPLPISHQAPIHVALAGYTDEFVPMSSNMSDVMTMIPGMYPTIPTSIGGRWPSVSYDYSPDPAPQPHVTPVPSYASVPTPAAPISSSHHDYESSLHAGHANHQHPRSIQSLQLQPPVSLPTHPPHHTMVERGLPMSLARNGPFRPSVQMYEPGYNTGNYPQPSTTAMINSPLNVAHFLNPEFQPSMWPFVEKNASSATGATGNRGRHKSTSQ